jgi:hypothetical protein
MTPITLAPHLAQAVDRMSKDMAVAPEALVNQAVFAWLRINGYAMPRAAVDAGLVQPAPVNPPVESSASGALASTVAPVAAGASAAVGASTAERAAAGASTGVGASAAVGAATAGASTAAGAMAAPLVSPTPVPQADPSPAPLATALRRMAEIDHDLERLAKPWPAWVEGEEPEDEEDGDEEAASPDEEDLDQAAEDSEDAPADEAAPDEEDAPADEAPPQDDEEEEPHTGKVPIEPPPGEEEEPAESTIVLKSMPITLFLQRGEEEPVRITSERFIIGRGPHCDLVIESPRVSREHVALTRAGISWFIEDLGSSNGTWFGEERVTKRELESGDVFNLGNEAVTFFLRGV